MAPIVAAARPLMRSPERGADTAVFSSNNARARCARALHQSQPLAGSAMASAGLSCQRRVLKA